MANLTITVDDLLLNRARIRALGEGTTVDALLREYLERYAGTERTWITLAGFQELARASEASSGSAGRTWDRQSVHDRSEGSLA